MDFQLFSSNKNIFLIKMKKFRKYNTIEMTNEFLMIFISDVRASSFRASGGLKPAFFEISGFGRVRVVQNLLRTGGQAGIYVHTRT